MRHTLVAKGQADDPRLAARREERQPAVARGHDLTIYWVHSAKPVVIKSDTQIDKLIGKGLLKETKTPNILDCPVTSVGPAHR